MSKSSTSTVKDSVWWSKNNSSPCRTMGIFFGRFSGYLFQVAHRPKAKKNPENKGFTRSPCFRGFARWAVKANFPRLSRRELLHQSTQSIANAKQFFPSCDTTKTSLWCPISAS